MGQSEWKWTPSQSIKTLWRNSLISEKKPQEGIHLMSYLQEQNVSQRQGAGAAAGQDGEPGAPMKQQGDEAQREHGGHAAQPHSPAHPLVSLHVLPGHRGRASHVTDGSYISREIWEYFRDMWLVWLWRQGQAFVWASDQQVHEAH